MLATSLAEREKHRPGVCRPTVCLSVPRQQQQLQQHSNVSIDRATCTVSVRFGPTTQLQPTPSRPVLSACLHMVSFRIACSKFYRYSYVILYADDILLLAPSVAILESLFTYRESFWRLSSNFFQLIPHLLCRVKNTLQCSIPSEVLQMTCTGNLLVNYR